MPHARLTVAGLFSGVGGLELGLQRSGADTRLLCDNWVPARTVLQQRFPGTPLAGDVTSEVPDLPDVDLVAAGFPCTDLSQAGRTLGIDGSSSGLVTTALTLIARRKPRWVLLENVPNMLHLARGRAMGVITSQLEEAGYAWAYRVVDSQAFGLAQRRRRVFLVAGHDEDPSAVLFSPVTRDGHQVETSSRADAFGFYWTEGNRGLGWAVDAVPTLKGSTTASVPSAPAVWRPGRPLGQRIVTPSITAAESLQGLPVNWTVAAPLRDRWKLVGNAVSPPVAEWLGRALSMPVGPALDSLDTTPLDPGDRWPTASAGHSGKRWKVEATERPVQLPSVHLSETLDTHGTTPLSARATRGFRGRIERSRLRYETAFRDDLLSHEAFMVAGA